MGVNCCERLRPLYLVKSRSPAIKLEWIPEMNMRMPAKTLAAALVAAAIPLVVPAAAAPLASPPLPQRMVRLRRGAWLHCAFWTSPLELRQWLCCHGSGLMAGMSGRRPCRLQRLSELDVPIAG